ncbi:MAG: HD domain-containing protein, partial [Phycisphaerales bacterium]|nr:HD domain-containing protein [Phycisphaerales bacterium]
WSQSEIMVVRRSDAVESWMFAEHVRRRMRRQGADHAVSVGVSSGDLDEIGSLLLDAEHASCLAASRGGNGTCTDRMVMVERLADEIEFLIGGDPEHRRSVFLSHAWSELGPGQRHYVDGHCRQVSGASYDLAQSIGLDADDIEVARLAGLFHDIGKSVVPESLLSHEGRLTSGEREIVRHMHEESVRLAGLLGVCPAACRVIAELGEDAPTTRIARLVRIADAICAMTSPRTPARIKAMHDAISTLEGDVRFDAGIVEHVRQRRAA